MPRATPFGRYWRGEGPLWRVYWIYGVALSIVITAHIVVLAVLKWRTPTMLVGAVMAAAVYTQWLLVSIWRCAPNVRTDALGVPRNAWGMLARCLAVAWSITAIGLAVILFQIVSQ